MDYCGRLVFVLLVLLFSVIYIVLSPFILPRVAPVGRMMFMCSRINNKSIKKNKKPLRRSIQAARYNSPCPEPETLTLILRIQFKFKLNSVYFQHTSTFHTVNNVYILCRKMGRHKTMLMDFRPLTITSKLRA